MNRRAPDQRGTTLLEALVALVISATLAIPLMAWMFTGLRASDRTEQASIETFAQNRLTSYVLGDGAAASGASLGGTDCGTSPREVLVTFDVRAADASRILYVAEPSAESPGRWTVHRHRCAADGSLVEQTVIAERVTRPAAGWTAAVSCSTQPALPDDPCGRIGMTLLVGNRSVSVVADRRIEATE